MPNDRLRTVLLERGITPVELAEVLGVDPKSVERWINGRTPYRRHRYAVAAHLGVDEVYLWPDALSRDQIANASESEIINIYPHRWAVPSDLWRTFFENADEEIGVLVYSGLFLSEDAGARQTFKRKAAAGVRVRILLGDPDSESVAQRGADEGIDATMAAKIRNAILMYKPLRTVERVKSSLNPRLEIQGVVLTMYDQRNKLSDQVASDVRQHLGDKVYRTVIPRNVRISEAPSYGKPALVYDHRCAGSKAYMKLASELIQRERALRRPAA